MSATRSQVVFASSEACGVDRPQPLVEQQDVVALGVELAAMVRTAAGAGAAMKHDGGLGAGRAASFPIEAVAVTDVEPSRLIRLDRRIKGAPGMRLRIWHQKLSSS